MISSMEFHDAQLRYMDAGRGEAVVLVHGYLESLDIWEGFAEGLSGHYRVVAVDLPGHGDSACIGNVHTMALMADAVKQVLDHLEIHRAVIVGHSMGGYATLAFAEIYPEVTLGFVLFHSHALADPPEKKTNRDRTVNLVRAGKKDQVIRNHCPRTFANDNLERLKADVAFASGIAADTPEEGIIAALEGMKIRPDRRRVISGSAVPVMYIAGRKDNFISMETAKSHFNLAPEQENLILEESGHMGFIEERGKSLEGLSGFLKKIY